MTEEPPQRPGVRASDAEREATVHRLEEALGEGRLDVDEFGQRAQAAYAAVTVDDLQPLVADLPTAGRASALPEEFVGSRAPARLFEVFGDVRIGGRGPVPPQVVSVFGDIRIDLRDLRTGAERIDLDLSTVFGDVDVIVAEGVDGDLEGWTVLGNRKVELARVPRLAGTPHVAVQARTVFGDVRLRSLPPGAAPGRWRALLDRLAQRQAPPPPPPTPPPPSPWG
jgi:hypothetical protein